VMGDTPPRLSASCSPRSRPWASPPGVFFVLYAWILSFVFFSECDNVGARCPLGACTTHGSVVVTSTLSVVMA